MTRSWAALAAAVARPGPSDPDREWKVRIRAAGALAMARALPELATVAAGGRFGPCPSCGASSTSGDTRPPLYERPSRRDGALVWTCRACRRTADAVTFAAFHARGGQPAHTPEEWAIVRRWLAERGIVAPDPREAHLVPAPVVPLRSLERPEEPAAAPPPPVDEVRALWMSSLPVGPGWLAVLGLGAPPGPGLARVLPGGGPPSGWPAWVPPGLVVDRSVVLPLFDATGRCRSLALAWTRPARAARVWWLSDLAAPLDAALVAARAGLRVLPLHGIVDGACTCSEGTECARAGKHPRISDWATRATVDVDQARAWWARWPDANTGVATGDGLVVLDVDGPDGEASLAELERTHGPLPVTLEVRSGREGGGRHLYLMAPGWHVVTSYSSRRARDPGGDRLGRGLDVRADGGNGLVVAPGSLHKTGRRYAVVPAGPAAPPDEEPVFGSAIAVAPQWFLDAAGGERRLAVPPDTGASGLVLASSAARAWLAGGAAPRTVVVVRPDQWLAAALRWPDAVVLGAADDGWTADWAEVVPRGALVVVTRASGLAERIEHTGRGRYRVEER